MKRKLTAWLLSGAFVFAMGTQAFATDATGQEDPSPAAAEEPAPIPNSVLYYGTVKEIGRDEQGAIDRLYLESEQYGGYIMHVSDETVWIDSGSRTADDPGDLKVGESLYVFRSAIATMSLPPQSGAIAVVRNVPQDAGCAQYHVVEAVQKTDNGSLQITTDNGGLILTVGPETTLSPYLTRNVVTMDDIKVGSRIMAWYDVVMTSYPGQALPEHVMLLPGTVLKEGAALTLELNGEASDVTGRYESGVAMVPVAAVAEALGLEAKYTPGETGAMVTVRATVSPSAWTLRESAFTA